MIWRFTHEENCKNFEVWFEFLTKTVDIYNTHKSSKKCIFSLMELVSTTLVCHLQSILRTSQSDWPSTQLTTRSLHLHLLLFFLFLLIILFFILALILQSLLSLALAIALYQRRRQVLLLPDQAGHLPSAKAEQRWAPVRHLHVFFNRKAFYINQILYIPHQFWLHFPPNFYNILKRKLCFFTSLSFLGLHMKSKRIL